MTKGQIINRLRCLDKEWRDCGGNASRAGAAQKRFANWASENLDEICELLEDESRPTRETGAAQWDYDLAKAPHTGITVFGCDRRCRIVVMHYANGWVVTNSGYHEDAEYEEFEPVGWLEIPPINLAQ